MGIKISEATPVAASSALIVPVSSGDAPQRVTVGAIKDYAIDEIEAIAAGSSVTGSDGVFVLQDGALKPVNIDLVTQRAIDIAWGRTAGSASGSVLMNDGATEKTVTLAVLTEYVRDTIRAAVLNSSTLDAAGALLSANLLTVTQGGVAKKVEFSALSSAIYSALATHVTGLTGIGTPSDADELYILRGSDKEPFKIALSALKSELGGGVTPPATTTTGNIPRWGASQKTLEDGLTLRDTVRVSGSADATSVPSELAVRAAINDAAAVLDVVLAESLQAVTLRGDVTIQVNGPSGQPIDTRALLHVWISSTDMGAPSATGNTVVFETGTVVAAMEANALYLVMTNAAGAAEVRVTLAEAGDRYVMVALGARIWSQLVEVAVV